MSGHHAPGTIGSRGNAEGGAGDLSYGKQQEVFCDLLEAHRGIVFKVARSYCRSPHDVEDVMQEIIGQMWRSFPDYDARRPFGTWAYRIALNVAISQYRNRSRRREVELKPDEVSARNSLDPVLGAIAREIFEVIERLDTWDRALMLLDLDGYRNPEIAEILGMTETNVATSLSRLRKRISQRFTNDNP